MLTLQYLIEESNKDKPLLKNSLIFFPLLDSMQKALDIPNLFCNLICYQNNLKYRKRYSKSILIIGEYLGMRQIS